MYVVCFTQRKAVYVFIFLVGGGCIAMVFISFCLLLSLLPDLHLLPVQSPADQCKKIHAGDEVIQVNHQTVVS